jgi:hypothetical protein
MSGANAMSELLDKLDSFADLPFGWDGYRGLSVKPRSIEKAKEFLSILPAGNWQAVPGSDGSLQLELHEADCDIEIYIDVV